MLEGVLLCVTRMVVACGILSSRGRQITVYSPQRGNTQDRTDHSKGMRAAVDRRHGAIKPPSRRSAGQLSSSEPSKLVPQHCRLAMPLPATRGVPDPPKPWCGPGHCQTDRRGTVGGLHRAARAWKHMTTREAWPQAQAQMSESVGGGRHAEQATHASRHCNQNTLADKLKGDTRAGRGGWVDPGDEASGVSAQDMSEQGSTGGGRRVDQPGGVA